MKELDIKIILVAMCVIVVAAVWGKGGIIQVGSRCNSMQAFIIELLSQVSILGGVQLYLIHNYIVTVLYIHNSKLYPDRCL